MLCREKGASGVYVCVCFFALGKIYLDKNSPPPFACPSFIIPPLSLFFFFTFFHANQPPLQRSAHTPKRWVGGRIIIHRAQEQVSFSLAFLLVENGGFLFLLAPCFIFVCHFLSFSTFSILGLLYSFSSKSALME